MRILIANDAQHQQALDATGFWGRRAAGCVFKALTTHRFLFAHRSRHVEQPNTWGLWGGALDDKETPEQGVKREVTEEAQYHGKLHLTPLTVFSHSSGFKYFNFLAVVAEEFEPRLDWETQGFKWVDYGDWPTPLHFGVKEMLSHSSNLQIMKTTMALSLSSASGFTFKWKIGDYHGIITAPSVRAAVSQSKLGWARQHLQGGMSFAYYQTNGNSKVKDSEVHLECPAASPEAIAKLAAEIHRGVSQEGKSMAVEQKRLAVLQHIETELRKFK